MATHSSEDQSNELDLDQQIDELSKSVSQFYHSLREKGSVARPAIHDQNGIKVTNNGDSSQGGVGGFVKRLAQYYAEFLSTDFKKQRTPRRRSQTSDAEGHLVGITLRKYPGFQQKVWEELSKPIGSGLSFLIQRGTWRSTLPKAELEVIATHINRISQESLSAVINEILERLPRILDRGGTDPSAAFEHFLEEVRSVLSRLVIAPMLDSMEGFFERNTSKPIESLKDLEDQLSSRLVNSIEGSSGAAFASYLVDRDLRQLEPLLRDQLGVQLVRAQLEDFFSTFNAGDLYVEMSDLVRSSRLIENAELYLHLCEVRHAGDVFPAFYIPLTAERTASGFKISSDPRLYVNKRAMDYVAQEVARSEGRSAAPSVLPERIFYLSPEQTPIAIAQRIFDEMAASFNLRADISFSEAREQRVNSMFVAATNRLSFSLFDRSDESMVNDYESLITGIDAAGDVVNFFEALIDEFLLSNPIPIRSDIERDWDQTPIAHRLVFDSPLPLVEEQRKILSAIKHPNSRFIAVEGPPGTGKSHTITAVAFDLILSGKSLLVLSDKREALDVVEDKLNQTLAKVRPSDDFPNPILRIGKDTSNYAKLLKKSAIDRLHVNQKVVREKTIERKRALEAERTALIDALDKTTTAYTAIDLLEISEFERAVAVLVHQIPQTEAILEDSRLCDLMHDFGIVREFLQPQPVLSALLKWQGKRPNRLTEIGTLARLLEKSPTTAADIAPITLFSLQQLEFLETAIDELIELKHAIWGYAFSGKKIRAIAKTLKDRCKIDLNSPRRELIKLKLLRKNLRRLRDHLAAEHLEHEFQTAIVLLASQLAGPTKAPLVPSYVLTSARRLDEAVSQSLPLFTAADGFYASMIAGQAGTFAFVDSLATICLRKAEIADRFARAPKIDYVGAKSRIESLNTQALAEHIDDKFIEFYDNSKNDALAIGKIIREKQRFPVDKFSDVRRAFPCVIAGLRDYAEFIPLERDLFDLVIIDEASQVSIAQALPAIIRAKKVLVLGDRNQFGNVKTSTASQEVNTAYMLDLKAAFTADYPDVSQTVRTKIDLFNIKSSVLDFIEPISNFAIQLKKHFRSYPEMISFSSKYFYGDTLQVMKIRGKSIEDVIEFDPVDHDGLTDQRNINVLEARRIVERLEQLLDLDAPPTVGVITPHTEQQAFCAKLFHEHPRSEEMYEKLKLKIMTFDTCQGEEREVIFYSLVASSVKDRLAYVFPSKLSRDDSAEIDHNLRLQRLNVGLSRGQEKLIFVHSKNLEEYSSALRIALVHYRNQLEHAKSMPTEADLDNASPMERKVLHWLSQVPLLRDLGDDCEIVAQFELGRYLRQLDPTYRHPDYRVDFLIRIDIDDKQYQIIVEYDGFEFHFDKEVPSRLINSSTWRTYLTPADLEREKVLESFGVPMIRLNRFNTGKDPVASIDALLHDRLDSMLNASSPHDLVSVLAEKSNEIEQGLKSGEYKRCRKCDRDLPIEKFRDNNTKSGLRRYCNDCNSTSSRTMGRPKFRRRYRR